MTERLSPDVFRAVADALPEPLALVGLDGTIVAANSAFRAEVTGGADPPSSLAALSSDWPAAGAWLRRCARSGGFIAGRLDLRGQDGSTRSFRCHGARVRPADGEPPRVLMRLAPEGATANRLLVLNRQLDRLGREVRRRREAESHEHDARVEAEAANRAKDDFLAVLSHELRTPLTAVLGWAQILGQAVDEPRRVARGLETIERNARLQLRLVEDLLDMSRITAGRLRLELDRVDMAEVVRAAIDAARPAAEAHRISLTARLPQHGVVVNGDGKRLQQAIGNLIANALKFTPEGGAVAVSLEQADGRAVVRVADTGIGIAPQFLSRIFDRFHQVDGASTRAHGGLGLGLAIARHIVAGHGGTIDAASQGDGSGATFTIRLPLFDGAASARPPVPDTACAGVRVLVVDDDADMRDVAAETLRGCGAVVQTAASADEALEVIRAGGVDVLVTDLAMPRRDGFWLIAQLRGAETAGSARLPALALTAHVSVEMQLRAREAGFDAYLPKPLDREELARGVGRLAAMRTAVRSVRL